MEKVLRYTRAMLVTAIKTAYPPPSPHPCPELPSVDFPDRRLSYVIVSFTKVNMPECVTAIEKAVSLQTRGGEPQQLVIQV